MNIYGLERGSARFPRYLAFYELNEVGHVRPRYRIPPGLKGFCDILDFQDRLGLCMPMGQTLSLGFQTVLQNYISIFIIPKHFRTIT